MSEYIISCDDQYFSYYEQLIKKLRTIAPDIGAKLNAYMVCGRHHTQLAFPEHAARSVRELTYDLMSDVILLYHKHGYFRKHLGTTFCDKALTNLYYTAVTVYDCECDAELLQFSRISQHELSVDGIFRFCLGALHRRWDGVCGILMYNFVDDDDREAVLEFVKHIVYGMPERLAEVNVYGAEQGYRFIDGDGRVLGEVQDGASELAARLMYVCPNAINVYETCDAATTRLLKNVFSDRITFHQNAP